MRDEWFLGDQYKSQNSSDSRTSRSQPPRPADDRRHPLGARLRRSTIGQVQIVVDDRNINQPTGTTSAIGDYVSHNISTGITSRSTFAGLPTLAYLGAFWNYLPVDGLSYNVAPGGDAKLGLLQSETIGSTMNFGARARQEVQLTKTVAVVGGATVERTNLDGLQHSFIYNRDGSTKSDTTALTDGGGATVTSMAFSPRPWISLWPWTLASRSLWPRRSVQVLLNGNV